MIFNQFGTNVTTTTHGQKAIASRECSAQIWSNLHARAVLRGKAKLPLRIPAMRMPIQPSTALPHLLPGLLQSSIGDGNGGSSGPPKVTKLKYFLVPSL